MMTTAAVLHTPAPATAHPLVVEAREARDPAPTEVAIDISACGVCRTDLQICEGDLTARRLPIVPGHQIVGRVVEIGVAARGHFAVGDRVGVSWIAGSCGVCRFCRTGRENLCTGARFTGWDRDGGFATYALADAAYVYRLPDRYTDLELAPLLCGGVIGYRCLQASGAQPGVRLGLYGFGSSATSVLQLALARGCDVAVVTRSGAERDRALGLGAQWAGTYDEQPPWLLDAAITFAPSGDVVIAALRALDRGGTVIVNAIHLDRIPQFDYDWLWWERSVRSVANLTRDDAVAFLAEAERRHIETHIDRYPLERVNDALVDLREGRVRGSAVIESRA